jgi:hypothetical protein
MGDGGTAIGVAILVLGGIVDYLVTEPFYLSLLVGTSFAGWNPLTAFLFLYGIPYAVSSAGVAAVFGAILGAT